MYVFVCVCLCVCVSVRACLHAISRVPEWRRVKLLLNFFVILATPHSLLSVIIFVSFDVVLLLIKHLIIWGFCAICYVFSCS